MLKILLHALMAQVHLIENIKWILRNECTCLETPGLVGPAACCSFSKRPLFLDTSSSRNRVLWVTSGDRIISDFYTHIGSRVKLSAMLTVDEH